MNILFVRLAPAEKTFLRWILAGTIGAGILFTGLLGFFWYSMRIVVENHYSKPLTVEEARQVPCPIPLPDAARNVQFAFASGGLQAFEILVRFEAPVDVCRSHAQAVVDAWNRQNRMPSYSIALSPITTQPDPEGRYMVRNDATWFDKEKIVHGETYDGGSGQPEFWIDEDRGVFYCEITD